MTTTPKVLPTLSPTFKATVGIPIAGEKETYGVEFYFRRMKRSEFREWAGKVDPNNVSADQVLAMATGWDLSDPFDAANLSRVLEDYPGSGYAIFGRYTLEQQDAKLGNSVR